MWVIANFKQNPIDQEQATALAKEATKNKGSATVVLAPSHVHLSAVVAATQGTTIKVCAQDVAAHSIDVGAYTGDVSAKQLAAAGACMALVGHSERRQYHNECNDVLVRKIKNAQLARLRTVLCVGESADDNDKGNTFAVLDEQLSPIVNLTDKTKVLVAYEPVWAIGSGKAADLAEIERVHGYIKQQLPTVPVLYGGSVNADNAASFASSALIDGVLVGGASLNAQSFATIVQAFNKE